MRPRKALDLIKPLLKAPSFTSLEARACGVSSATLAHYVKRGEIRRIGHGVYRGIRAPVTEEFRWEDLVEAIQRVRGGVICLISALSLYELTEEVPRRHWIAIRNDTVHRGNSIVRIVRMRNLTLGKTTTTVGNITVPIFDRERTIIDSFRYLSREIAIKALKMALAKRRGERIDFVKLMKYAKTLRVKIQPYLLALTT